MLRLAVGIGPRAGDGVGIAVGLGDTLGEGRTEGVTVGTADGVIVGAGVGETLDTGVGEADGPDTSKGESTLLPPQAANSREAMKVVATRERDGRLCKSMNVSKGNLTIANKS